MLRLLLCVRTNSVRVFNTHKYCSNSQKAKLKSGTALDKLHAGIRTLQLRAQYIIYPLDGAKSYILFKIKALQVLLSLQLHLAHMSRGKATAERALGAKLLSFTSKAAPGWSSPAPWLCPRMPHTQRPARPELLQPGIK